MMSLPDFEILFAENLRNASLLLSQKEGTKLLAGGTDVFVSIRKDDTNPKYLVSLAKIPNLDYITFEKKFLKIGPLTTLMSIEKNKRVQKEYRALFEAVRQVGSVQVRNMATLVGNICNASPAADTVTPLLVFNARVCVTGPRGKRIIPLNKFFKGPKISVLRKGEIVTEVQLPREGNSLKSAFVKISRVAQDLSKVNAAAALKLDSSGICSDARLALGAVAPVPLRVRSCEELVNGKKLSEVIEEASAIVPNQISPITDLRSTSEYRNEISKVVVRRVLSRIMEGQQ